MSVTASDMMARVSGVRTSNNISPAKKDNINYSSLTVDPKPSETENQAQAFDPGALRHSAIVARALKNWERNKYAKQITDIRLLKCLRMARGEYSASEIAEFADSGSANLIYMKLGASRASSLAAWLEEILLTPGDRPCGLDPRPLPELPSPVKQKIEDHAGNMAKDMMVAAQKNTGQTMDQASFSILMDNIKDELETQVKHEQRVRAKESAEKMEQQVYQLMDDGGFDKSFRDFLEHFSRYPTAFLKGPFQKRTKRLKWGPAWQAIVESKPTLAWKAVNPFDIYPSPMARNCQDGAFIERMRLSHSELFDFIGVEGYDEEAIRWVLDQHSGGWLKNWVWTDAERMRLEKDMTFGWITQDHMIDALAVCDSIEGQMLIDWGAPGQIDPQKRYEVFQIIISNRCIYLTINDDPLGRRPYRHACYEENPDSIWGLNSVLELCEASEQACNAAARSIIYNMGMASGPQVWIDIDRLPPGTEINRLVPWDIRQFNKPPPGVSGTAAAPMGFYSAPMVVNELLAVYNHFSLQADDTSGIPRYVSGDEKVTGAASTMGGLSMLMGAAARRVRRAIGSIDYNVMAETVYDCFIWAMRNIDDHQIKGDCVPVPRGSAALLVKEQAQQGRQAVMNMLMADPKMRGWAGQLIGVRGFADLLKNYFKGMHLPDIIADGLELDKIIDQISASESAPPPPSPEQIKAQTQTAIAAQKDLTHRQVSGLSLQTDLAIAQIRHGGKTPGGFGDTEIDEGPSPSNPSPGSEPGLQSPYSADSGNTF